MSAPTRTRGDDSRDDDSRQASSPTHRVKVTGGRWAYSEDGDADYPRGLYRYNSSSHTWEQMAPLPHVREVLARRDGYGRCIAREYRLAVTPSIAETPDHPGEVVLVDGKELCDGKWAEQLGIALSADDKVRRAAATAITEIAARAPSREFAPRWVGDELQLPPPDVLAGYGDHTPDPTAARQVWAQIGAVAARNPKVALTLGVSLGGLFIAPLDRQSFTLLMTGRARGGKTATLQTAAAIYGNPKTVSGAASGTNISIPERAGELGCLPIYLGEVGASGLTQGKLENLILRLAEGSDRMRVKFGGGTRTSPEWHGVMLAAGNDSILSDADNEAIAARVLEVPIPITTYPDDAFQLKKLARAGYGWPLRWLLEHGPDVAGFAARISAAHSELATPGTGGVEETLVEHLAVAVAGAELLEQLIGTTGIRAATLQASRDRLAELLAELADRGAAPGPRIEAAVRHAWVARRASFPDRAAFHDGNLWQPRGDIEGVSLVNDPTTGRGTLAVFSKALPGILAAAGVASSLPGLRELRDAGRLLPHHSRGLLRQLRLGPDNVLTDVYVFVFAEDDDTADESDTPDPLSHPRPGCHTLVTGYPPVTCDSSTVPLTCDDGAAVTPSRDAVTGVTRSSADSHAHAPAREAAHDPILTGRAGPVWRTDREPTPCRVCHSTSVTFVDELGPIHPNCATTPEAAPPAAATSSTPAAGTNDNGNGGQSLASGIDVTAVQRLLARQHREGLEQGYREGMSTVQWFSGKPPTTRPNPDTGPRPGDYTGGPVVWNIDQPQPRRDEQAAESGSEGRSAPAGADTPAPRREAASKPQGRPDTAAAADDPKGLERCARLIREDYPDATDADIATAYRLFRQVTGSKVDGGLRMIGDPGFVGLTSVQIVRDGHNGSVRTAPLDSELVDGISHGGDLFRYADHVRAGAELGEGDPVTVLDSNSAWLAAAQSCELGDSAPAHYTRPRTIRQVTAQAKWSKRPGYVLLDAAPDLAAELPGLASLGRGSWVPTPWVDFLLNPWPGRGPLLGSDLEVAELVYWHKGDHGRRLSTWAAFMRDAGLALAGMDGLAVRYALKLLKRVRNGFLGGYLRSERYNRTELLRPDWSDLIVTQAGANLMRKLTRAALEHDAPHPIGVYRDDVWYAADQPPAALVDAGEVDPTKLGKLKVKGTIATTAELAAAIADRSTFNASTAVAAALRQEQP